MNANAFDVEDTDCISLELTGNGTNTDPYTITAEAVIDPSPDNVLVCDGAGLLVDCDTVVDCVGNNLGCGLEFSNGSICVAISEDDGNQIECRDDGLYASFDCDDLGCGLTLDGDGNIAVDVGAPGDDKQGLECTDDGVVGIDLWDCQPNQGGRNGLRINAAGQLQIDVRAVQQVGDARAERNINLDIPNVEVTNAGGPAPANATIYFPQDFFAPVDLPITNPNCYPIVGQTWINGQFEILIERGTDIEVDLEVSVNGGPFVVLDKVFRYSTPATSPAIGESVIVSEFFQRTDINNVPATFGRLNTYRLAFHRTRVPNGDRGYRRARVLAASMTPQFVGHINF